MPRSTGEEVAGHLSRASWPGSGTACWGRKCRDCPGEGAGCGEEEQPRPRAMGQARVIPTIPCGQLASQPAQPPPACLIYFLPGGLVPPSPQGVGKQLQEQAPPSPVLCLHLWDASQLPLLQVQPLPRGLGRGGMDFFLPCPSTPSPQATGAGLGL